MVFHEITRPAIERAVDESRDLDRRLVDAQETRRILDRLYGYEVSPVLWKKVMPNLSAGRVQSVATRLLVERERARMRFVAASFWDLAGRFAATGEGKDDTPFGATLVALDGARLATGRDFGEDGQLNRSDVVRLDEAGARGLADRLADADFSVRSVEEKPWRRSPAAPFMTSTLQQEAGRKLRFSSARTMRVAQDLYEPGYITYMRTDSTTLSDEALDAARAQAAKLYGRDYVPAKPRRYDKKVKNAQEAHEAIRPAGDTFRTPEQTGLGGDMRRLYELVWMRTVASQMADAAGQSVQVRLGATSSAGEDAEFATSGRVITFPGFLRAYVEGTDDPDAELEDREVRLPALAVGDALDVLALDARGPHHLAAGPLHRGVAGQGARGDGRGPAVDLRQHPRHHPGARLRVEEGVGAGPVVDRVRRRRAAGAALRPAGRLRLHRLDGGGPRRDRPGRGRVGALADPLLLRGAGRRHRPAPNGVRAAGRDRRPGDQLHPLGMAEGGEPVVVRVGRYGPYVQRGDDRASVPEDLAPDELTMERAIELLDAGSTDRVLGKDPDSGLPVIVKAGRFGPYVQVGEAGDVEGKPRTASLLRHMDPATVTLDDALLVLSLPRIVGTDPATGEKIVATNGRYGPYLKRGSDTRSLDSEEQLFTVTLDEALALFAQPKTRRGQRSQAPLRELGADPATGEPMVLKEGRFGPYVTDGTTNASLRKGDTVDGLTPERAAELLADRRAAGPPAKRGRGTKKAGGARKAAKKKTVRPRRRAGRRRRPDGVTSADAPAGRGRLIVLEGGEGTGKSTQAALLAQRLEAVLTREPGGTEVGERLRRLVLDPSLPPIGVRTEVLVLLAARAQHVVEVIEPALAEGRDVVCDRFSGSTLAYQGYGRGLDPAELARLSAWATGGREPDRVVLLRVAPEVAAARLGGRGSADRMEEEDAAFFARVAAGYEALAAADPQRWRVVDGAGSVDEVAGRVWDAAGE